MPTKTLLPPPYLTLEDANGATIVGGTVTFHEAGTAVLAVIYADAEGLVIAANPVTVDGAARYTVFLSPGQVVDVTYRDASGALLKTVPGVQGTALATGNTDIVGIMGDAGLSYGTPVFLSRGDYGVAGQWHITNGAAAGGSEPMVGIVIGPSVPAGATQTIRLAGRVTGLTALVPGAFYYLSNTLGQLSLTPGTYGRLVGQADSPTSLVLWPNPPEWPGPSQAVTLTGNVSSLLVTAQTVYLANPTLLTINGIFAGYHGQRVRFVVGGGADTLFAHNSGAAFAEDRLFNFAGSAPTPITHSTGSSEGGTAEYVYDVNVPGWRLVSHTQGDWITPPFSAADYFGGAPLTWTVSAANMGNCAYYLHGRMLTVQITVFQSVVGGSPSNTLIRNIPGGFVSAGGGMGSHVSFQGSVGLNPSGAWTPVGNQIHFRKDMTGGNTWVADSNTWVAADMTIQVT